MESSAQTTHWFDSGRLAQFLDLDADIASQLTSLCPVVLIAADRFPVLVSKRVPYRVEHNIRREAQGVGFPAGASKLLAPAAGAMLLIFAILSEYPSINLRCRVSKGETDEFCRGSGAFCACF